MQSMKLHYLFERSSARLYVTVGDSNGKHPGWNALDLSAVESRAMEGFDSVAGQKGGRMLAAIPDHPNDPGVIPPAVIETELMKVYVRPAIYERLVNSQVIEAITREIGTQPRSVRLSGAAGTALNAAVLRHVLRITKHPVRRRMEGALLRLSACGSFLAALAANIALVVKAFIRGWNVQLPAVTFAPDVMVVYPGLHNHTRHVWDFVASRSAEQRTLILCLAHMSHLDPPRAQGPVDPAAVFVVMPLRLRDYARAATDVLRQLPVLISSYRFLRAELGSDMPLSTATAVFSRLHRGCMYQRWVDHGTLDWRRNVVFGLATGADALILDLALQRKGARTVHWLHGRVGSTVVYQGVSSLCLTHSTAEAAAMADLRSYGACVSIPAASTSVTTNRPRRAASIDRGLLLASNFLHPSALHSRQFGLHATLELLDHVSQFAADLSAPERVWRPHPHERAHAASYETAKRHALAHGWRVSEASLADDLKSDPFVITTPSSLIADVAARGILPAVYQRIPLPTPASMSAVPTALAFHDARSLHDLYQRMMDPEYYVENLTSLSSALSVRWDMNGVSSALATAGSAGGNVSA